MTLQAAHASCAEPVPVGLLSPDRAEVRSIPRLGAGPRLRPIRTPEPVALAELHAQRCERAGLLLGLNTFRNQPAPGGAGEVAHPHHKRLTSDVDVHPAHDADVKLHEFTPQ